MHYLHNLNLQFLPSVIHPKTTAGKSLPFKALGFYDFMVYILKKLC